MMEKDGELDPDRRPYVDAIEVRITSREHEEQMRRHVQGGVAIDVIGPEVAFACARCGVVLAFAHAESIVHTHVECPGCGTLNAI